MWLVFSLEDRREVFKVDLVVIGSISAHEIATLKKTREMIWRGLSQNLCTEMA